MKGINIMKSGIYRIVLMAIIVFFAFVACDKIDEPLVIIDQQTTTDGLLDDNYVKDSVMVTTKHVLLEDFTGHKCVNCPEAAIAAHELAEELNHRLIIYSVHAGYYATPDETGDYTADFRCMEGEELYNDFAAFANPIALIDRVKFSGAVLIGAGNWEDAVVLELAKENTVDLKVRNIYYPDLGKIQISVTSKFLSATADPYKLVVYIVEDGIVSPQKNNNPDIGTSPDWIDYEHRNILRTSVNSTYGGFITPDGTVALNQEYTNQFIFDLNAAWVTANCNLIAYIYNDATKEILQVAELGIKTTE
jgi:thiol-disulfide isomerase/thioredoxin